MAKTLYLLGNTGSGKTELIRRTHEALGGRLTIRAIYSQQQSIFDLERLRAAGITAVMNNGNLPVPAERSPDNRRELVFHELSGRTGYSLPKSHDDILRVLVFSVTEGDEKPLKYPRLFKEVEMVVLNKIDLLPFTNFSVSSFQKRLRTVNPGVPLLKLSCRSGVGLDNWRSWVLKLFGYHDVEESRVLPCPPNFPGLSLF
ncbi:MAG TPA: hydrogenase nickel incorporation protein HypB [Hydrogenispora sp.]|jgi:hydrogenase nickel incorporation protein HypB|nr:hydrogenase nickel incorporation protein HypB [Hydrogenispora sp.]